MKTRTWKTENAMSSLAADQRNTASTTSRKIKKEKISGARKYAGTPPHQVKKEKEETPSPPKKAKSDDSIED